MKCKATLEPLSWWKQQLQASGDLAQSTSTIGEITLHSPLINEQELLDERKCPLTTHKKWIITYQEILARFVNTISVDKQLLYEMDSYPEYGVSLEDTYLFCDDIFPIPYNSYYQSLFSYDDSSYLGSLWHSDGVIV